MSRLLTDPAVVRDVLDYAAETSLYAAARRHGIHAKTILRWRRKREALGPAWPTDADIAAWRVDHEANEERRRRDRDRTNTYRKRLYLNRGPVRDNSLGVARRLQSLLALGWTQAEMGEHMGVGAQRVSHLMQQKYPVVNPATVAQVHRAYAALSLKMPPPKRTDCNVDIRARTVRYAESRGYVRPLMWDNIDDPAERPSRSRIDNQRGRPSGDVDHAVVERVLAGAVQDTTRAERVIITRRWLARGGSETELCTRMGWRGGRYANITDYDEAV